jgi:tetratricopeptide (TPR) repeat protein
MKRTMCLIFFAGIMGLLFGAADLPDLNEARKLASEGKYEEALKKHLWFYEESKNSPGMGGVRLSYALDEWLELADKYPPAKKALIETRDKNESLILEGKGNFNNFHDLSSINRVLGEKEKTLELFRKVHKTQPELAVFLFIVAKDLLVENKEYKICGEYIKDSIKEFENIRHLREVNLSIRRKSPQLDDEQMRTWIEDTYVNSTCQLIEILLAIGKKDEAKDIQRRALEYHSHEKIKVQIID